MTPPPPVTYFMLPNRSTVFLASRRRRQATPQSPELRRLVKEGCKVSWSLPAHTLDGRPPEEATTIAGLGEAAAVSHCGTGPHRILS
jgi:hypothetical protein